MGLYVMASPAQMLSATADLFFVELSAFVKFIKTHSPPGEPNVTEFSRLLNLVQTTVGVIPIIENVGWYFNEFKDEIINDEIQKLLDHSFSEYVAAMKSKPVFAKYAGMASTMIPMMKDTFMRLNPTDKDKFKFHVNELLSHYITYSCG
jgi:hypothetical protein